MPLEQAYKTITGVGETAAPSGYKDLSEKPRVLEDKIEGGAVTSETLAEGAVTDASIEDDSITQSKIADDAVSLAQLKVTELINDEYDISTPPSTTIFIETGLSSDANRFYLVSVTSGSTPSPGPENVTWQLGAQANAAGGHDTYLIITGDDHPWRVVVNRLELT